MDRGSIIGLYWDINTRQKSNKGGRIIYRATHNWLAYTEVYAYIHIQHACMHAGRKHKHVRWHFDELSPISFCQFCIVLHVFVSVYLQTPLCLSRAAIVAVIHYNSWALALDYHNNSAHPSDCSERSSEPFEPSSEPRRAISETSEPRPSARPRRRWPISTNKLSVIF
jgi:hypothetical protein